MRNICRFVNCPIYSILYTCIYITDVHKGLYKDQPVAFKKLKDDNRAAQAFLQEASLMT